MKLKMYDLQGKEGGQVELPPQFQEAVRIDLIKRLLRSAPRRQQGAKPGAGMRHSAELSRRRKKYRGSYGYGISRVTRKIFSHQGTRFNWAGALSPGTVGGRRAHPPKATKIHDKKINKKERRKAMCSALAATVDRESVMERGHKVPETYPFVMTGDLEQCGKVKDLIAALQALGFQEELARIGTRSVRAGRGKLRGRRFRKRTGPLFVVSGECPLQRLSSLQGVDVVDVTQLLPQQLAPGHEPGRMTIFTQAALDKMKEEKLFA